MKLNPNEKNVFEVLWQLIKLSKLKVTATSLKNAIQQHREASTLVGLSDVLNEFNIPNLGTRLSPEQLYEIPLPAVGYFDINGGTFVTIKKIENDIIEWYHDQDGIIKESIQNFIHKWQGITLLIEPNDNSGEENYRESRRQEIIDNLRIPFILTGLFAILSILLYNLYTHIQFENNWQFYSLLLTKSIGLVVSIMLIWYSIDSNNSFLRSVCQLNDKTNCNNILNSKAAKIFGWLTWSEVGLFYFAGGFLSLLMMQKDAISFLSYFGILALPYTLWSIYYQAFVVKEWCPLCVSIQALLWIEFFINPPIFSLNINLFPFQGLFISFLITPILWSFLKKPLQKSLQTDSLYVEFQKLKHDPEYINTLLSKEVFLPPFFKGMNIIEFGNPLASNNLILVLNPTCASCRVSYLTAKRLLEMNMDIKVQIVLATSLAIEDEAGRIARIILSQVSDNDIKNTIDEWFKDSTKNINKWLKRIETKAENNDGRQQIEMHVRWLELTGISEAPVKFLNNHEIPKVYLADDLLKLIKNYSKLGFANQQ
jgi:uncharacterized membrane protein